MKKVNKPTNIGLLSFIAASLVWLVFALSTIFPVYAAPQPVVDIKANGNSGLISVSYGSSVNVSWTSIYANWCMVEGVGWTGISGSHSSGSLTYDTTYNVGCSGPGGWTYASVTVLVGKQSDPSFSQGSLSSYPSGSYVSGTGSLSFGAGCAASPSTAEAGQTVVIAASSANGVNPVTYRWGGDVSGGGSTITTSFSNIGTKIVSMVATDAQGRTANASCNINVVPASPKISPAPVPSPAPSPRPVVTTASKSETDYDKICRDMGYIRADDVELAKDLEENNAVSGEDASRKRSLLASVFFTDSGYPSWLFFTVLVLTIFFVWMLMRLMNGRKKEMVPVKK
jgi:hypothetical protein